MTEIPILIIGKFVNMDKGAIMQQIWVSKQHCQITGVMRSANNFVKNGHSIIIIYIPIK